jgi:hypothetical protein
MYAKKLYSLADTVVVAAITVLWLFIFNLNSFIIWASGNNSSVLSGVYNGVGEFVSPIIEPLQEHILSADVVTFVLWFLLGLVCYVIVGLFISKSKEIEEELRLNSSEFVHSNDWNRKKYQKSVIIKLCISFIFSFLLLLWLILVARFFIPSSSSNMVIAFFSDKGPADRLLALLLSFVSVYVVLMGALIIFRVGRDFSNR